MKKSISLSVSVSDERRVLRQSILFAIGFTVLLWLIRAAEWSASLNLGNFGIFPRSLPGMIGILTGPLIHGTFWHLLSNTFPLIFLLIATFYFYNKIALEVFLWIYLITGFWVWVAARQAYHIGSSGIVYGLAAFLFFSGLFRKDVRSVVVAVAIAFLYNGMLQGLFPDPNHQNISWESHLLGSAAGVFCSFYFRRSETPLLEAESKTVKINTPPSGQVLITVDHTFHKRSYFSPSGYCYAYCPKKESDKVYVQVLTIQEKAAIASEI
ncbi:MAG: rhomboid family intramembrane serine protease [Cyclobacteriaceae bacterium]